MNKLDEKNNKIILKTSDKKQYANSGLHGAVDYMSKLCGATGNACRKTQCDICGRKGIEADFYFILSGKYSGKMICYKCRSENE